MQKQPYWREILLRKEDTAKKYDEYIAKREAKVCPLCDSKEIITEYDSWVVMRNKFPYDRYFEKSDMLVTKRHITDAQLSDMELAELQRLKHDVLYTDYDSLIEHFPEQKSIPEHGHYHLVQYQRADGQPR
jgi:hypothetical protein